MTGPQEGELAAADEHMCNLLIAIGEALVRRGAGATMGSPADGSPSRRIALLSPYTKDVAYIDRQLERGVRPTAMKEAGLLVGATLEQLAAHTLQDETGP